jgi:serine/threonine protein kinase HipA of HipAB toxin-antitoxin module
MTRTKSLALFGFQSPSAKNGVRALAYNMKSIVSATENFCRMVFIVKSRNCGDHSKSFAFVMNKYGEWKLVPAYDICHAYRPDSGRVSQHWQKKKY